MFIIEEITVEEQIAEINFACDLQACKGACCTLKGGRGAPLLDSEVDEIRQAFPSVRKYLPKEHLDWIEKNGLVEGYPGRSTTQCVNDEACVFVYYEDGIAKCSFEKAYLQKEIQWRKPVSCHLFPIRREHGVDERLRFEYLHECRHALQRGEREKIPLYQFLESALTRVYGSKWYNRFKTECERHAGSSKFHK
jgi:Protein of unknown function (DUF3109)